jgi:ADP-heptose:LPS heptosyltransferase
MSHGMMQSASVVGASIEPGMRKIVVLRANGIGDLMFALPALDALRHAYPDAEVVLLATEWHAALLDGRPGPVDRVVPVPVSRGVRMEPGREENAADLDAFFAAMRKERFDLAVQIHGGGRHSNRFVARLGARLSIGLRTPDALPLDRTVPYVYFQPEILRYLEVVSLVGARPRVLEPSLAVTPRDLEEAAACLPGSDRPAVVLHPSAGDPRRRWPAEKFGAIARALSADGAEVSVVGIAEDADLVAEVVARAGGQARNLCGRLTLGGLAGLLSRSTLLISNDSGPLHLAAAVGTATVGIYWCGNLINAGPLTRTRHRPLLSWTLDCPVCGADTTEAACSHRASFVARIAVAEVLDAARDVLQTESGETRQTAA